MNSQASLSRAAERSLDRLGLTVEHLLGLRFAINVFIAATIVWATLRAIGDSNPIWAIASMVAASDPQPEEARRMFRGRIINVLVGCGVGFALLLPGRQSDWLLPVALALTVLISTYVVRIQAMWRQAPITAAVVIAAGITHGDKAAGIESGLHRVAEVIYGCLMGLIVSWLMSKLWLVRPKELPLGTQ
ncbi:MAG: FUSC family protein [Verrucomicrobia bacterium]|nr:FUSC family protein [Verrucomicrobiota bacterium]